MRLSLAITIPGLMLAASVFAQDATDPTFESVVAQLAEYSVVRGNYSQTREIELLSRPLESSGFFVLSDLGLYWQQDRPFKSVLIADGERLVQRIDDGPVTDIDAAKHPMVLPFSRIFLSIFKGSEQQLREHFTISFDALDSGWAIGLKPASYPLSEAIDTINLGGREYIESLTVISRSSDKMTITFTDHRTQPDYLTEHEIELYSR